MILISISISISILVELYFQEYPEKVLLNHGLEGKFLCGGHRLAQKEKCVIYSIGMLTPCSVVVEEIVCQKCVFCFINKLNNRDFYFNHHFQIMTGSRGDYSFEEDMHAINPNCEIHTFDPGVSLKVCCLVKVRVSYWISILGMF